MEHWTLRALFGMALAFFFVGIHSSYALEYHLGLQGGAGFSNIEFDPESPTDPYAGGMVGLTNELVLNNDFYSIVLEVNYVRRGALFFQGNDDRSDLFQYLEVPLMFRFRGFDWLTCPTFCPYAEVGASISFKMHAQQIVELDTGEKTEDIGVAKSQEYSLQLGLGAESWITPRLAIFVGGRYVHGLTRASASDNTFDTVRLRTFEIFGGPKFEL